MLTRAAYMQVRRGDCADACEERGRVGGIAAALDHGAAAFWDCAPSRPWSRISDRGRASP